MNRSLGFSTGAVLMLGIVLRSGTGSGTAATQARDESSARSAAARGRAGEPTPSILGSGEKKINDEGPWTASCHYWEPSTKSPQPLGGSKEHRIATASKVPAAKTAARTGCKTRASSSHAKSETGPDCQHNADAWGIPVPRTSAGGDKLKPAAPAPVMPDITAIIAAVPDPLHTHLALQFDRDIDAILQAAAENGYLPSQYWLPWKLPEESAGAATATPDTSAKEAERARREQQPGLIVLKHAYNSSIDSKTYDWSNYDQVIYLFIVGESPASGMNGAQLRNAFGYEAMLKSRYKSARINLSTRGKDDLAIIGSPNSGSAVSLREAIEAAKAGLKISSVHVAGSTQTEQANRALHLAFHDSTTPVEYVSFGEDFDYEKHETLNLLSNSGYDTDRVAFLVEDGTAFGNEGQDAPHCYQGPSDGSFEKEKEREKCNYKAGIPPLIIRFPREISLLRNAQVADTTSTAPSPYLRLTLKDPAANDTVPHFSAEQTPLSQEASLMAIQRDLTAYHIQFLAIQATNMLDQIYLANYFHRACPNLRLVFLGGGDLLLEREVDNVPYIGSVTMTPYNLVGLMRLPPNETDSRAFPDSMSEAMFNAASYTFQPPWLHEANVNPKLAGYSSVSGSSVSGSSVSDPSVSNSRTAAAPPSHASLWATVIGADGYYPLGVAASCASDSPQSLPAFVAGQPQPCAVKNRYPTDPNVETPSKSGELAGGDEMQQFNRTAHLFPCLTWTVLSIVLALYCSSHSLVVLVADFWSPVTRDVAIRCNDQPARRSVYMNIGTVMLFSMVFVLEWPVFCVGPVLKINPASRTIAVLTLVCGVVAVLATLFKTLRYSFPTPEWKGFRTFNSYQAACSFFNLVALTTLVAIPLAWMHLCSLEAFGDLHTMYGVFFSLRCLHPDSQVSPAVPVLLVLLAWYLWAYCQTFRLRFSKAGRPRLPGMNGSSLPLSVTDVQLAACSSRRDHSLYQNITCLLITRELLVRFVPHLKTRVSVLLTVLYCTSFGLLMHFRSIESVDRMILDPRDRPTCYEALLVALTGPLLVIGLAGWLRIVLIWGSLRRGLLERLEMYPLRAAFTRLKGIGWMTMMRDAGLHRRWKDMARSNESIRQLVSNNDLLAAIPTHDPACRRQLEHIYAHLQGLVADANVESRGGKIVNSTRRPPLQNADSAEPRDLPDEGDIVGLELIAAIESDFAAICEVLLRAVLIPYWTTERGGFVEGEALESAPIHAKRSPAADQPHNPIELHAGSSCGDPEYIRVAEELLALRYLSLIRAVLGNIRYLMTFVSAAFVLSLVAWNSYPFQPKELIDWAFTLAFLVLGGGIIWVFAQMHRNALLSRITDTSPNELGFDFYWRLITFGAIPLLTWLSYQFPQAWSGIFRMVQPSLSAMK